MVETKQNEDGKRSRRLKEIDFLRGVAILLVLFRHQNFSEFTTKIGWIGVDLFFVLSGFLVSGLLFQEYKKFGNIKPLLFLARRGFKIYPVYYLTFIPYLFWFSLDHTVEYKKLLADLVFVQNYVNGFGYIYSASWSLAVEEHFYFVYSFVFFVVLKFGVLEINNIEKNFKKIVFAFVLLFSISFILRVFYNYNMPGENSRNFSLTHLRIDSLLAGVLLSYFYFFMKNQLADFYLKYKPFFFVAFFLFIAWVPFFDALNSFFAKTTGFTLLYLAFSSLLTSFLFEKNLNEKLTYVLSSRIFNFICSVGVASYSIYIIHILVGETVNESFRYFNIAWEKYSAFAIYFCVSIFLGMFLTKYVERFFLKIRDKYFPSRIASVIK